MPTPISSLSVTHCHSLGLCTVLVAFLLFLPVGCSKKSDTSTSARDGLELNPESINRGRSIAPSRLNRSGFADALRRPNRPMLFDQPLASLVELPRIEFKADSMFTSQPLIRDKPSMVVNEKPLVEPGKFLRLNSAQWQIEADPSTEGQRYTIAPDLDIAMNLWSDSSRDTTIIKDGFYSIPRVKSMSVFPPLSFYTLFGNTNRPVLACQNGPFMLVPPPLTESRRGWKLTSKDNKWVKSVPTGNFTTPLSLFDLRTGKSVCKFDARVPFWMPLVLSPDGQTLVSPSNDTSLEFALSKLERVVTGKPIPEGTSLLLWKRDSTTEPVEIRVPGHVVRMKFANNRALVLLLENPTPMVQVWDIQSRKKVREIQLPNEYTFEPRKSVRGWENESQDTESMISRFERLLRSSQNFAKRSQIEVLAMSGGGNYAAVGAYNGRIAMVDVRGGKLVGEFPSIADCVVGEFPFDRFAFKDYSDFKRQGESGGLIGIQFSEKGDALNVCCMQRSTLTRLVCDFTTGSIRRMEAPSVYLPYAGEHLNSSFGPDGEMIALNSHPVASFIQFSARTCRTLSNPPNGSIRLLSFLSQGQGLTIETLEPDQPQRIKPLDQVELRTKLNAVVKFESRTLFDSSDPKLSEIDLSKMTYRTNSEAPVFRPIAKTEFSSKCKSTFLPGFWPTAWANDKAVVLRESDPRSTAHAEILDMSEEGLANIADSIPIYTYSSSERDQPLLSNLCIDPAAEKLAFVAPKLLGLVEVWSIKSRRRHNAFLIRRPRPTPLTMADFSLSMPKPQLPIEWLAFDHNGNLLTLENGAISGWDIGSKTVKGRFSALGGYRSPIEMSPDHRLIFASRESSLEVLDSETGQNIARLNFEVGESVREFIPCPDGSRLALLMNSRDGIGHTLIWNLTDDSVSVFKLDFFMSAAWLSPDHLIYPAVRGSAASGRQSGVFDFAKNRNSISFNPPLEGLMRRSIDGRFWMVPKEGTDSRWQSVLPEGNQSQLRELRPDLEIFRPRETPIQVAIDLCDDAIAERHSKLILSGLQKNGWKIGPSNYTLYVTGEIDRTSGPIIMMENRDPIAVPQVKYRWRLMSNDGVQILETHSLSYWTPEESDYRVNKNERNSNTYHLKFDKDAKQAILEEIVKRGSGLYHPLSPSTIVLPDRNAVPK